MSAFANPYYQEDFIGFFFVLFSRIKEFIAGKLAFTELATDEIQLLVLSSVSMSAALVGTFLILRKMTMLANSISHTILVGIVIAFLVTQWYVPLNDSHNIDPINLKSMLIASVLMGILTSFLTEFVTKNLKLQEDASIGLVFTSLFALGILMVTTLTRNAHIGAEVVMGNVDALHVSDIKLVAVILVLNILVTLIFYKEYLITSFDPGLAKALGVSVVMINYLLMTQVSLTIVGAFRAVGVIMVLSFLTALPLAARLLFHRLPQVLLGSMSLGILGSVIGVALSRHLLTIYGLSLSTAGVTVCIVAFIFLFCLFFSPSKGVITTKIMQHRKNL
jgi:manganese/zinc/iron transport system permease protein